MQWGETSEEIHSQTSKAVSATEGDSGRFSDDKKRIPGPDSATRPTSSAVTGSNINSFDKEGSRSKYLSSYVDDAYQYINSAQPDQETKE